MGLVLGLIQPGYWKHFWVILEVLLVECFIGRNRPASSKAWDLVLIVLGVFLSIIDVLRSVQSTGTSTFSKHMSKNKT